MKYSVIIPSYNSETTIVRCLRFVTEQQFDKSYEIIVVDSFSDTTSDKKIAPGSIHISFTIGEQVVEPLV